MTALNGPCEPFARSGRLKGCERWWQPMFGRTYDKLDWAIGALLLIAMVAAVLA